MNPKQAPRVTFLGAVAVRQKGRDKEGGADFQDDGFSAYFDPSFAVEAMQQDCVGGFAGLPHIKVIYGMRKNPHSVDVQVLYETQGAAFLKHFDGQGNYLFPVKTWFLVLYIHRRLIFREVKKKQDSPFFLKNCISIGKRLSLILFSNKSYPCRLN